MNIDEIISFGPFKWRVLAVENEQVLLITETIIGLKWYHSAFTDITWENCALRKYLNAEFYEAFSDGEQELVMNVTNRNPDNPWFGTKGGADTNDRIFLLNLEEVCTYFGDSRGRLGQKNGQTWRIDDEHNIRRQAGYLGENHWWRLRSPGYYGRTSAGVTGSGHVYVRGNGVHGRPRDGGGVRPALWLKTG